MEASHAMCFAIVMDRAYLVSGQDPARELPMGPFENTWAVGSVRMGAWHDGDDA